MEEQNGLSKQNRIFSMVEKNERKMKNILLFIVISVIAFSSVLSLTFSYRSYTEVKNIINKNTSDSSENIAYETLIVSYSNGSLLRCNESGCNNTVVHITNDGEYLVFCHLSFVDISGDGSNYEYTISYANQIVRDAVPGNLIVPLNDLEIKPGESKDFNVSLYSIDGDIHNNYQLKVQVSLDMDKNAFLE